VTPGGRGREGTEKGSQGDEWDHEKGIELTIISLERKNDTTTEGKEKHVTRKEYYG